MRSALKDALEQFRSDNLSDWAAALTYYALLSLFPALIALVAIIGLVGDPETTTEKMIEVLEELGSDSTADTFSSPIESIATHRGTAGLAFFLGLAVAIWSSSGYIGAFGRASEIIYGRRERRPFWRQRPRQLAITAAMLALAALLAIGLVLSGPLVDAIAGPIGVGATAVELWKLLKLPAMAAVFIAMVGLLYSTSLEPTLRGIRWFSAGSLVAVVSWAIASFAFSFYLTNFGSYDRTYGTLGGVVALLVWLWITNLAVLFGHVLNAQLERDPG